MSRFTQLKSQWVFLIALISSYPASAGLVESDWSRVRTELHSGLLSYEVRDAILLYLQPLVKRRTRMVAGAGEHDERVAYVNYWMTEILSRSLAPGLRTLNTQNELDRYFTTAILNRTLHLRNETLRRAHRRAHQRPEPLTEVDFERVTFFQGRASLVEKNLQTAMETLRPRWAGMLQRFWNGDSYSEIAEHYQVPAGTVMSSLSRARAKLVNILNQSCQSLMEEGAQIKSADL